MYLIWRFLRAALGSVVLGIALLGLGAYVYFLRSAPPLQPWHTVQLEPEFSADKAPYVRSVAEYLELEQELFGELEERLYRQCPDDGRSTFVRYCIELGKEESDNLLQFLFRHSYRPEFECRFRWHNNSVAMWDNRCTQHRGINDFFPAFRLMQRIPLVDERRPSMQPQDEAALQFGDVPYVNTEELFETRPEMAYGHRTDKQ